MDPSSAAWGQPGEFQLAIWSGAEDAHAWAPAGLPPVVEYSVPTDMFGNTSLQPYLHSSYSAGQQQLALCNYDVVDYGAETVPGVVDYVANAQTQDGDQNASVSAEEHSDDEAMSVFEDVAIAFQDEAPMRKLKMHRFPPNIAQALGKSYTVPRVVAIGPYHHGQEHLMAAEKVKQVSAYHCMISNCSVRQMYEAVVPVADDVRALYDKDVMSRIADDDFRPMMFYDACFLVQFMRYMSDEDTCPATLYDFFESHESDVTHDIMLLENQIPWQVVEAVMGFTPVTLESVIGSWKERLVDRVVIRGGPAVELDPSYEPPHLLGFVRFYLARSSKFTEVADKDEKIKALLDSVPKSKIDALSISVSAIELDEMGINLKANQTAGLAEMELTNKGVFAELSMAPLSLDNTRASWHVNMAALELCTTPDFFDREDATYLDSVACSYLLLLCMLVHREEDVHQLRTKRILQGAGLTDKEVLKFFTSIRNSLRAGLCFGEVMVKIEMSRRRRRILIALYWFVNRNWKTIVGIGSAIGAFASILKTLQSLKGPH
ncbi:hypothetical protein HU200_066261 [Digitaria exilis]|uniref:Uncharacterized protein n=1 Tax=Digitaria exilis TaxID=1010633 RepID=A0A835DWS2_9POAL|nr:hypothetical protein HU200_066261 [Digitaria exilis]